MNLDTINVRGRNKQGVCQSGVCTRRDSEQPVYNSSDKEMFGVIRPLQLSRRYIDGSMRIIRIGDTTCTEHVGPICWLDVETVERLGAGLPSVLRVMRIPYVRAVPSLIVNDIDDRICGGGWIDTVETRWLHGPRRTPRVSKIEKNYCHCCA